MHESRQHELVEDVSSPGGRAEQRRYQRFPVAVDVRIYWEDGLGQRQDARGKIIDASAEGLDIELALPFAEGTLLSVETQNGILHCVVRHQQRDPRCGRLGVQIVSWTESWCRLPLAAY